MHATYAFDIMWWYFGQCAVFGSGFFLEHQPVLTHIEVHQSTPHLVLSELNTHINALKQPFFNLDLAQSRQRLQSMPWVKRAHIKRVWPNTLKINLDTYTPVAQFNDAYWFESNGATFKAPKHTFFQNIPLLEAKFEKSKEFLNFFSMSNLFLNSLAYKLLKLN